MVQASLLLLPATTAVAAAAGTTSAWTPKHAKLLLRHQAWADLQVWSEPSHRWPRWWLPRCWILLELQQLWKLRWLRKLQEVLPRRPSAPLATPAPVFSTRASTSATLQRQCARLLGRQLLAQWISTLRWLER
jgi:hypothetical protein